MANENTQAQIWVVAQHDGCDDFCGWSGTHESLEDAKAHVEAEVASWGEEDHECVFLVRWQESSPTVPQIVGEVFCVDVGATPDELEDACADSKVLVHRVA